MHVNLLVEEKTYKYMKRGINQMMKLRVMNEFQIAKEHAMRGAVWRLGKGCAKERVALAAVDATASHRALPATNKCAPATTT